MTEFLTDKEIKKLKIIGKVALSPLLAWSSFEILLAGFYVFPSVTYKVTEYLILYKDSHLFFERVILYQAIAFFPLWVLIFFTGLSFYCFIKSIMIFASLFPPGFLIFPKPNKERTNAR